MTEAERYLLETTFTVLHALIGREQSKVEYSSYLNELEERLSSAMGHYTQARQGSGFETRYYPIQKEDD